MKIIYKSIDGLTVKREDGLTPNGNELNQRWVLRDKDDNFIDFDQYRHDLAERNNFRLTLNPENYSNSQIRIFED